MAEQTDGTLLADVSPQEAGTVAFRRAAAVRRAAYDQVRSSAERGVPSERENCSARAPDDGVYFCYDANQCLEQVDVCC